MAHVFHFKTSRFDLTKEAPNPINPLGGQSLLNWLRGMLESSGYAVSEPDTEDWGWYVDVTSGAQKYLVGASADANEPVTDELVEWAVQVVKTRSLTDNLFGRNKQTEDDHLDAKTLLRNEPDMLNLEVDRNA